LETKKKSDTIAFRKLLGENHDKNVQQFLAGVHGNNYPRPGGAVADMGAMATAMRLEPLANMALKSSGYGTYASMYRVAAGGLAAAIMSPKMKALSEDIMPMLARHIKDAGDGNRYTVELPLRLYYLLCSQSLTRLRSLGSTADELPPLASDDVLDKLGYWAGPSQWMYAAHQLDQPQHTSDWAAWYTSRLCETSGGWRLLACVGASQSEDSECVVPHTGVRYPAWCLAARDGEAVLALRGSVTYDDWFINKDANEAPLDVGKEAKLMAHGGILRAAQAILKDCGAGDAIDKLRARGVNVTLVGHSLGGGVASLMTALLNADSDLPRVKCYSFATPACCSVDLAELLKPDVVSCVLQDDVVPRLSDSNCARLAAALILDEGNYIESFAKDKTALANHTLTLGARSGMVHDVQAVSPPPPPITRSLSELVSAPTCERLVVPGVVVFLQGVDGNYDAFETDYNFPELNRIKLSTRAVDDHSTRNSILALRVVRAKRNRKPEDRPAPAFEPAHLPNNTWAPCKICDSDVTWTSRFRTSDAARASSTHHCRACGVVVCAFCAPAGDSVAADGVGKATKLVDLRVTAPSMSFLDRIRVCRPCAFNSYNL
jgi:pimeloyl-ACP methyl ester carboxylesterase